MIVVQAGALGWVAADRPYNDGEADWNDTTSALVFGHAGRGIDEFVTTEGNARPIAESNKPVEVNWFGELIIGFKVAVGDAAFIVWYCPRSYQYPGITAYPYTSPVVDKVGVWGFDNPSAIIPIRATIGIGFYGRDGHISIFNGAAVFDNDFATGPEYISLTRVWAKGA